MLPITDIAISLHFLVKYFLFISRNKDLSTKVEDLEIKVEDLQETIQSKNNQIFVCQEESRGLQAEMTVVNKVDTIFLKMRIYFLLIQVVD